MNDRSTKDIRGPPIVVFVVSRALFYDFLFVLFDLFDVDGSFLVLKGGEKGEWFPKTLHQRSNSVPADTQHCNEGGQHQAHRLERTDQALTLDHEYCSPPRRIPSRPYPRRYTNAYTRHAYTWPRTKRKIGCQLARNRPGGNRCT